MTAGLQGRDADCAAALAALGVGPARLARLADGRSPAAAWAALVAGTHPEDPDGRLQVGIDPGSPERLGRRCRALGIRVLARGAPGYPTALSEHPDAPAFLFAAGDPAVLAGRARVAVVGTRNATRYGLEVARELGTELAAAGVVVVSGLAAGIDAAAQRGALTAGGAPVAAVVAPGPDVPYPRAHAALQAAVAERGVVVSELPPGSEAPAWRFVARNRVTAALAHVVVVVESRRGGGAVRTAALALERGVTVAAVPGSVRSPASTGTNALLADGAVVVRDVDDVLAAVLLATAGCADLTPPVRPPSTTGGQAPPRATARSPGAARLLRLLDAEPQSFEVLVGRAGLAVGEVALALEELVDAGAATGEHGWWSLVLPAAARRRRRSADPPVG